jgi:hypothetical protein
VVAVDGVTDAAAVVVDDAVVDVSRATVAVGTVLVGPVVSAAGASSESSCPQEPTNSDIRTKVSAIRLITHLLPKTQPGDATR